MGPLDDTIAAVATAPGEGGIAVVRVSGSEAGAVASRLLRGGGGEPVALQARGVAFARVREPGSERTVDEVLALWMPGPASYTREDVLEIQCHGGQIAGRRILELVLGEGVRIAEPGEFTLRAYLRGRIDLVQAEAVLDTIQAQTAEALEVHEELLGGRLSQEVARWQQVLGRVLARVEAELDFAEEELGEWAPEEVLGELEDVAAAMGEKLGTYAWGRTSREGFRVALLGSPNAGKSSLLNCLAEDDHAIVSPIAGTTRDAMEVRVNAGGVPVRLVDTAGLRSPGDPIEEEGVRRARKAAAESDLIVLLCDGGRELSEGEVGETRSLMAGGKVLPVVSKVDLGRRPEAALAALFGTVPLGVSVLTGEGVAEVLGALREAAWGSGGPGIGGALTRQRHRTAVQSALSCVTEAMDGLRKGIFVEVVASRLHEARRRLSGLLGWGTPEDVLEAIFSEFCIGK
ncbi:MAG: tRNA uridine-5-carboxymethylaminomethyl(34) synthesis GTPase MnmE [Deltaproteobacteria bacterium]|nr:tRNA uridine-5-carboxymethylaminomethyl(34) synthesis GTPase MnmE [Deltaproteobacteria bacterium]